MSAHKTLIIGYLICTEFVFGQINSNIILRENMDSFYYYYYRHNCIQNLPKKESKVNFNRT